MSRCAPCSTSQDKRRTPLNADFVGFEAGDEFLVGYGLDWATASAACRRRIWVSTPRRCVLRGELSPPPRLRGGVEGPVGKRPPIEFHEVPD